MKATKYKLSMDKLGLLKYFKNEEGKEIFYHIHSDELTPKEKKVHKDLLKKRGKK